MSFSTPTNLVPAQASANGLSASSEVPEVASFNVKAGLAQMLKVDDSTLDFDLSDNTSGIVGWRRWKNEKKKLIWSI